jgi:beta-fructofuranosidase
MLYLNDWIVWDFWLAPRLHADEPFHCYFLQAPRSLPDPEMRHDVARIGHATSPDLVDWTYHGEILPLGRRGDWDDMSQWTGSIVRDGQTAYLFYTGRSRSETGNVQRVGLATSQDLFDWRKIERNPILEATSPWYVAPIEDGSFRSDCRDPWVIRYRDHWLMYYTASAAGEPIESQGVVGTATSPDLENWIPGTPVIPPGRFGEIEVPQVFPVGHRWAMIFCTARHACIDGVQATWNGTHYFIGDSPLGPFELAPEPLLQAGDRGTNYAARVVPDPWLGSFLLAWRRFDDRGKFVGALTDPYRLEIDHATGRMWLAEVEPSSKTSTEARSRARADRSRR